MDCIESKIVSWYFRKIKVSNSQYRLRHLSFAVWTLLAINFWHGKGCPLLQHTFKSFVEDDAEFKFFKSFGMEALT